MNEVQAYQPKPRNPMMIKNLCPGLMEMGKIKIGNKGAVRKSASGSEWQAPQKLDHFLITTNERGKDNNFLLDESLHRLFGDAPKSIPVRMIYDDISLNFATRYICYYGKTVFCSGDGECATRLQKDGSTKQIVCPCERQDPKFAGDDGKGKGKCKINGILSVIIDGAQAVGGVWKFRTTSYNSVVGIMSSLALIQRITGGRLAGIPMNMTVSPKTVQDPIQGSQQTIYVVGLQYAGTIDTLRDTGYQIAMTEAKHGISMARIEEDARLLLSHTPVGLGDDLDQDVIEEFYPEEAAPSAPALVDAIPSEPQTTVVVESANAAPALVEPQAEVIDVETGEITEQQPAAVKQTRTRRTKEQIEADKQQQDGPPAHILESREDDFPEPPGSVSESAPHPADEPELVDVAAAEANQEPAESEEGDLF